MLAVLVRLDQLVAIKEVLALLKDAAVAGQKLDSIPAFVLEDEATAAEVGVWPSLRPAVALALTATRDRLVVEL